MDLVGNKLEDIKLLITIILKVLPAIEIMGQKRLS